MRYRKLGHSGVDASVVGLGTWAIGGWMWGGASEAESVRVIHAAMDAGITLVDTAPVYGFGVAEEVVGKAIRDRREKVVLATKCGLIWHEEKGEYYFTSDEKQRNSAGLIKVYKCLAGDTIRYEVEESLRRLGTEYIDLLQTHWQTDTTPVPEIMETLMALKAEGKIRAIGCSNASRAEITAYGESGLLDTDQELYSMLDRDHEEENLPYCQAHGVSFLAYSPLAQGLLTGKVGADRIFGKGDQRSTKPRFSTENRQKVLSMLDEIRPIADHHGITLGQLAIAWTIVQPGCTHVLAGARREAQALENAKAADVNLTIEELQAIKQAIARHIAGIPA